MDFRAGMFRGVRRAARARRSLAAPGRKKGAGPARKPRTAPAPKVGADQGAVTDTGQKERDTEKTAPSRPEGWPYLVGSQLSLVAPTAASPRIQPFRSLVTPTL